MTSIHCKFLFFALLLFSLVGCGERVNQNAKDTPTAEPSPASPQAPNPANAAEPQKQKAPVPIITKNSFQNISPGDLIADHQDQIEKGMLRTAEGDFESYQIKNEEYGPLAYFMPDPTDEKRVGDITIHSPLPTTKSGIRVGDTFGKLLVIYRGLEVHGSEVESRTYAYKDNLLFRIDEAHGTYELALSEVSKKAKILEIVISRN